MCACRPDNMACFCGVYEWLNTYGTNIYIFFSFLGKEKKQKPERLIVPLDCPAMQTLGGSCWRVVVLNVRATLITFT